MTHVVRVLGATVLLLVLAWLAYRFIVLQPGNQRNWDYGLDVLPHFSIDDNVVLRL